MWVQDLVRSAFCGCFLTIPSSAAKGNQLTTSEIKESKKVAIEIFVKKSVARIKWFRILTTQLRLLGIPLLDDIVICCCGLANLLSLLTGD